MSIKTRKQDLLLNPPYFSTLEIEDVMCFKGKHKVRLYSRQKDQPAQWTVILGNNNTGKTTLLRCIAALDYILYPHKQSLDSGTQVQEPGSEYGPTPDRGEFYGLKHAWPYIHFENDEAFNIHASLVHRKTLKALEQLPFEAHQTVDYGIQRILNAAIPNWGMPGMPGGQPGFQPAIFSYGASRKMSAKSIADGEPVNRHSSLFENDELPNIEDWLLKLSLSGQLKSKLARQHYELARRVLMSGLLPDVSDLKIEVMEKEADVENYVAFRTDYGWVRLRDLGYGYQAMIAWVLDLVRRMIVRYSHLEDPLSGHAVVLVDEIDLHLHPDWQRRIIAHLTQYFPNVQFIVTAHSPLIVQSAEEVNLIILKKEENHIKIDQPQIRSFKGWTIEEIMSDLMQLDGKTMSKTYLDWMQRFDEALDEENLSKAHEAYEALDQILHPESHQRKLLRIQMAAIPSTETL